MTTWQYSTRSVKRRERNERIAAAVGFGIIGLVYFVAVWAIF